METIKTEHGYYLTLRERQIMVLMIAEAQERTADRPIPGVTQTLDTELTNVRLLIGDYVAAYKHGRLSLSDFERCG